LLQTFLSEASGRAERDVALLMAEALPAGKRVTLGGDKNYDTQEFIRQLRGMHITPHVAQNRPGAETRWTNEPRGMRGTM
jgi:hypothetical protein